LKLSATEWFRLPRGLAAAWGSTLLVARASFPVGDALAYAERRWDDRVELRGILQPVAC
jgi:hypothetical protein